MFRAIVASLLIAQTLIIPLTGKRVREFQTEALFHTLFHDFFPDDDNTTYVQTGDIPAMWLRDSSAQTIPYVRFQGAYPILQSRFNGVIQRNMRAIDLDVYANAFQEDYHTWERKWEVDSVAWPVLLAEVYYRNSHDRSMFSPNLHVALRQIVHTYTCEEHHRTCSKYDYPYHVYTDNNYNDDTGLIWCAFRPSDDAVQYRFNIPQNVIAVVALREIERLAVDGYGDTQLASDASAVAARVMVGIERYGKVFDDRRRVWMYAYETDGNGRYNLMDDANIPNLTTLPYLDWSSAYDPAYLNTRAFTLSMDNPWFFSGTYAEGLGSPHTPYGYVWPLGIIGRALTSTDSKEVETAITTLAETDSEGGLIHESFYPNGYWRYTRAEFGWANALGAELIFRTVAGYRASPFVHGGVIMPFETRSTTPELVPSIVALENSAAIVSTLDRLLNAGRDDAVSPKFLPPAPQPASTCHPRGTTCR